MMNRAFVLALFLTVPAARAAGLDGACVTLQEPALSQLGAGLGSMRSRPVESAIAKLASQRNSAPLANYYADGVRIEGCWANPAGKKLTDLKKAFYCSMPLEFRLCNTVVLLTTDESKVEERYQGYLACQARVDAAFGGKGQFRYDDEINSVYRSLYLEGNAGLSPAAEAAIIAANRPRSSGRPFPALLGKIGASLIREGVDRASSDFDAMVHEAMSMDVPVS